MELLNVLNSRFSCRHFDKDKDVDEALIKKIVQVAPLAPSANNKQAYHIYVVPKALLERSEYIRTWNNAPVFILACTNDEESWVRASDNENFAAVDIAIVVDHMMLRAQDLGLNTCFIASFDVEALQQEFNLPKEHKPYLGILVGYAADYEKPNVQHMLHKTEGELISYIKE